MKKLLAVLFMVSFSFSAVLAQDATITKKEIKYEIKVKTVAELESVDWAKIEKILGKSDDFNKTLSIEIEEYKAANASNDEGSVKFSAAVTGTDGESASKVVRQMKKMVKGMMKE